ncbi:hypothetical protein SCYZ1_41 [Pseudomonas phage SCYZ1]|nr:hypothetical protein SCYZ1_41 [Pseudomonas phage SCYZ1]
MMDLMGNLMQWGGQTPNTPAPIPTDMSQVKVPQQAMDLSGVTQAANSQLQYNPQATPGTDWSSIGMGALAGLAGSTGSGGKQQQQGLMQPRQFDGRGQEHKMVAASDFSGANGAAASPLIKLGLMGQRS